MYRSDLDHAQAALDAHADGQLVAALRARFSAGGEEMRGVFAAFDEVGCCSAAGPTDVLQAAAGALRHFGKQSAERAPCNLATPQAKCGTLPPRTFDAACAALSVVLSAKEREWAARAAGAAGGATDYSAFCRTLGA